MRLNPLDQLNVPRSLKPWLDTVFGSIVGLVGLVAVSAVGSWTFFVWFPIWLIFRYRKWREKKAAAREELRA